MIVQLLTEHHLELLSLKAGCRGSSESTLVKMSICWKSHAAAHLLCSIHIQYLHTIDPCERPLLGTKNQTIGPNRLSLCLE